MSQFMFGVHASDTRLPLRARLARSRAAKELRVVWVEIKEPNGQWKSWFVGPNRGHPFDADLQRDTMRTVDMLVTQGPGVQP